MIIYHAIMVIFWSIMAGYVSATFRSDKAKWIMLIGIGLFIVMHMAFIFILQLWFDHLRSL